MYGLKSDPGIDVLKGQTLEQICIGENTLFLNFSGDISIGTYSCIGLGSEDQPSIRYEDFVAISQELLRLLSKDVKSVGWTPEGTITIKFLSGKIVELYDDSSQFESYTIAKPNGLVVV
jgi:hypothetical protein